MPEQLLWRDRALIGRSRWHLRLARLALAVLWVLGITAFAWTLYRVLSVEAPTQLQLVFWVLSTICFAWVSIGAVTAAHRFRITGGSARKRHACATRWNRSAAGQDCAAVPRIPRGTRSSGSHHRYHVP